MTENLLHGAKSALLENFGELPDCALVLGSGLAPVVSQFERSKEIRFPAVPGFPVPGTQGHAGRIILTAAPHEALIIAGRPHLYEGFSAEQTAFPIKALALAGIKVLLLTNAAGGLRHDLKAGDICLIEDQINLQTDNPLRGPHTAPFGERHIDCSELYEMELARALKQIAFAHGVELKSGVYAAVNGPQYETPAEARMLSHLGADIVGMSTVAEALAARQAGLRIAGLSLISNRAGEKSSHSEVLEQGAQAEQRLATLLLSFLETKAWKKSGN